MNSDVPTGNLMWLMLTIRSGETFNDTVPFGGAPHPSDTARPTIDTILLPPLRLRAAVHH